MQRKHCGRQRFVSSVQWSAVVLPLVLMSVDVRAQDETSTETTSETESVALFEGDIPESLTEDAFAGLPESWASWGASTASTIETLYTESTLDRAGQRDVVERLQKKVGTLDKAIGDRRYRSIHGELRVLRAALKPRVDLAAAILDTIEMDPQTARTQHISDARKSVLTRVAALKADMAGVVNGSPWLAFAQADALAEWANSTSEEVATLDTVIAKLQRRTSLKDEKQRAFLSRDSFVKLEGALAEAKAAVTAELLDDQSDAIAGLGAQLFAGFETLNDSRSDSSVQLRALSQQISAIAPDRGRQIQSVVNEHYMNHNFRLQISEGFLGRLVREQRVDRGPVRDHILGAAVSGNQTTTSEVGLELKPNASQASFNIVLDGVARSSTAGVTSQATIYTSGNHRFIARKGILFDGYRFETADATIGVNANNTTTGASTRYDRGLFRGIARRVAMREAARKRGQSEAIAESRVRDRVLPEFNTTVEEKFVNANAELNKLIERLQGAGLAPGDVSVATTDSHLQYSSRVMSETELGGGLPIGDANASDGLTLQVHESFINNSVDRLQLAGRTITEQELKEEIERGLSDILGRQVTFPTAAKSEDDQGPSTIIFASADPIRFRVTNNRLTIVLRAGFKQEDKEDIPTQVIRVPLEFDVADGEIQISRGTIAVSAVEKPDRLATQIARAGVVRKKLRTALPDRTVPADREININGKPTPIKVSDIRAANGWLHIVAQ